MLLVLRLTFNVRQEIAPPFRALNDLSCTAKEMHSILIPCNGLQDGWYLVGEFHQLQLIHLESLRQILQGFEGRRMFQAIVLDFRQVAEIDTNPLGKLSLREMALTPQFFDVLSERHKLTFFHALS